MSSLTTTKARGVLWFYSSSIPYMSLQFGGLSFYIDFNILTYCVPIDDQIIIDEFKDETEQDKKYNIYMKKLYGPSLINSRILNFDDTQFVAVHCNCDKYRLEYGTKGHTIVSMELNNEELKQVITVIDTMIEEGKQNAYGDFVKGDDLVINLGVSSYLKCKVSTWKYERTEHKCQHTHSDETEEKVITLNSPIQVQVVPNSQAFAPWMDPIPFVQLSETAAPEGQQI